MDPGPGRVQLIILSAALALAAALAAPASAQTLVIGRSNIDSVFASIAERVSLEAFGRIGAPVRVQGLPLQRSIEMTQSGEIDGDTARAADISERYPEVIALTGGPTIVADVAIYALDDTIRQRTRAQIRAMSVCTQRGAYILVRSTEGMKVHFASAREDAFEMLADGRCQVLAALQIDVDRRIATGKLPPVARWPYLWASEPLYLALNRRHAALAPRLNKVLDEMNRDGTTERLRVEAMRANGVEPLKPEPR